MNKIEDLFLKTFEEISKSGDVDISFNLEPQKTIGIYKVDFTYGTCAVEIDGHEFHKTKEQREHDYKRERYLLRKGYTVVRFMATEVYLEPERCVVEAIELGEDISIRDYTVYYACKEHDVETVWGSPLFNSKD